MLQLVDLLLQHRDLSYLLVDDQVAHVEHLSSVFAGADSHERRIGDVVIFQQGLGFEAPHQIMSNHPLCNEIAYFQRFSHARRKGKDL